jgi:hypothetical protein
VAVKKRQQQPAPRGMLDGVLEGRTEQLMTARKRALDVVKQHLLGYGGQSTVERLLEVEQALKELGDAYEALIPVFLDERKLLGFVDPETNTVCWVGRLMPVRESLDSAYLIFEEGSWHA